MSPAAREFDPIHPCPKPGLCLDLLGRAEGIDRDIARHEQELRGIRDSLTVIKQDVHTLVSQAAARDRMSNTVVALFGALLVAGLAQFGTTVWWGSRLQSTTEQLVKNDADQDAQLKEHSRLFYAK